MALTTRLDLRQTQALVMTPQLQQAIKLLQLSNIELTKYVEQQLEQNPLLERDESGNQEFGAEAQQPENSGGDRDETGEPRSVDLAVGGDVPMDPGAALDMDGYGNLYDVEPTQTDDGETGFSSPGSESGWQGRGGSFDDYETSFENTLSAKPTLREHLTGQLAMDIEDPVDRIIGAHLIDQLDEAGYIADDFAPIAGFLGCNVERVEATLRRLQQFDPAGIFARNLAECLALQLRDRDRLDRQMQLLLANLEMLAKRDWTGLTKVCGVGPEKIATMVSELQSLNPKPASTFDHDIAQPVTPDIFMRPQSGSGWIVELNNETLPRVLVNNHYYARISREVRDKGEKQYINECLQSASWLVKSLHQRATTILKVATEIIRQQDGFFVAGIQRLRPLILRDIAQAIDMHESTVSRVTSNKFMATPRGIYELKYFFTTSIGSSDGGDTHSAESVRYRIKALIDTETAKTVLSDDALAETLQKEGIDIARRTVAKYREGMGIPSSVRRRREKGETLSAPAGPTT
jgi:RNA polymerase sigma-54 factor